MHGGRLLRVTVGGVSTWPSGETFCYMGMIIPFIDIIFDLGFIRRSRLVDCGVTGWLDSDVEPLWHC